MKLADGFEITPKLGFILLDAYNAATKTKHKKFISDLHAQMVGSSMNVDLDKNLSSVFSGSKVDTIARKIEKLVAKGQLGVSMSPDNLVCEVSLKTLSNMCSLSDKLDGRKSQSTRAADLIDKVCNFMKKILGRGVSDKSVIGAIDNLERKERRDEVAATNKSSGTKLKSFADKVGTKGDRSGVRSVE